MKLFRMIWFPLHAIAGLLVPILSISYTYSMNLPVVDNSSNGVFHTAAGGIVIFFGFATIISGVLLRIQRKGFVLLSWVSYVRAVHMVTPWLLQS